MLAVGEWTCSRYFVDLGQFVCIITCNWSSLNITREVTQSHYWGTGLIIDPVIIEELGQCTFCTFNHLESLESYLYIPISFWGKDLFTWSSLGVSFCERWPGLSTIVTIWVFHYSGKDLVWVLQEHSWVFAILRKGLVWVWFEYYWLLLSLGIWFCRTGHGLRIAWGSLGVSLMLMGISPSLSA